MIFLHKFYSLPNIIRMKRLRRMRGIEHVAHVDEKELDIKVGTKTKKETTWKN
jgi:hypothetical protein